MKKFPYHDLSTYVEVISDDFQSTFSVLDKNTLANMMHETEIPDVVKIIKNYIPDAKIEFEKTNTLDNAYDIYIVRKI